MFSRLLEKFKYPFQMTFLVISVVLSDLFLRNAQFNVVFINDIISSLYTSKRLAIILS